MIRRGVVQFFHRILFFRYQPTGKWWLVSQPAISKMVVSQPTSLRAGPQHVLFFLNDGRGTGFFLPEHPNYATVSYSFSFLSRF
jgi:hypothetical protein